MTSTKMIDKIPPGVRVISQYIDGLSKKYVSDRTFIFIGSFFLLRFINPCIFSPERYGLLPKGEVPDTRTRRNLILLSKLLQKLSNAKTFSEKDQYMTTLNDYILSRQKTINRYFERIIDIHQNIRVIHEKQNIRVNVYSLYVFHALLFKHKGSFKRLVKNRENLKTLRLMMEKIVSYSSKASFSFLEGIHQKAINPLLESKHIEIGHASYIERMDVKKKKERIIVVGRYRILELFLSGKLASEHHQLDLVKMLIPTDLTFIELKFTSYTLRAKGKALKNMADSINRAYALSFRSIPSSFKYKILTERELDDFDPPEESYGGFASTYRSLCDYYHICVDERLLDSMNQLENRSFNLVHYQNVRASPLTDRDLLPAIHALTYNNYFDEFKIKRMKFDGVTSLGLWNMLQYNRCIRKLTLSHLRCNRDTLISLFGGLASNAEISLGYLDLSGTVLDSTKLITTLSHFFSNTISRFKTLNLSGCFSKALSFSMIMSSLVMNRKCTSSLECLDVSKNEVGQGMKDLALIVKHSKKIEWINLSQTAIGKYLNQFIRYGILKHSNTIKYLDISWNRLDTPGLWKSMLEWIMRKGHGLKELNISSTFVPSNVFKALISKAEIESRLTINGSHNALGLRSAKRIAQCLKKIRNIERMDLSNNSFTDEGVSIISDALFNNRSLVELDLSRNFKRSDHSNSRSMMIRHLIELVNFSSCPLEVLRLAGSPNHRLKSSLIPFIKSLGENHTLRTLDISGHQLGDEGIIEFSNILYRNRTLTTVIIDDNDIGRIGLISIKGALKVNTSIKSLTLPMYDIYKMISSDKGVDEKEIYKFVNSIQESLNANQLY